MTTLDKIQQIMLGHRRRFGRFVVERVGTDAVSGSALVAFVEFDTAIRAWVRTKELPETINAGRAAFIIDCEEEETNKETADWLSKYED